MPKVIDGKIFELAESLRGKEYGEEGSMVYQATVYQVFIAPPSDVMEERDAITKAINSWNNLNSHDLGITILPVKWETNSTPELGDRPQALINKNLCALSDILIGVFWTRIGSPCWQS